MPRNPVPNRRVARVLTGGEPVEAHVSCAGRWLLCDPSAAAPPFHRRRLRRSALGREGNSAATHKIPARSAAVSPAGGKTREVLWRCEYERHWTDSSRSDLSYWLARSASASRGEFVR